MLNTLRKDVPGARVDVRTHHYAPLKYTCEGHLIVLRQKVVR